MYIWPVFLLKYLIWKQYIHIVINIHALLELFINFVNYIDHLVHSSQKLIYSSLFDFLVLNMCNLFLFRLVCLLFEVKISKRNRIGTQWACGYCYVPFPVVEVSFNPRSGPSFFFSCGPRQLLLLFCHNKYSWVLFSGIWDSHAKVLNVFHFICLLFPFAFVHFCSFFLFKFFGLQN